jgi:two-component system, sensor histidine kinase RetS
MTLPVSTHKLSTPTQTQTKRIRDGVIHNTLQSVRIYGVLIALITLIIPNVSLSSNVINISEHQKIFLSEHAEYIYSTPSVKDARMILNKFPSSNQPSSSNQQWHTTVKDEKIRINTLANIWFKLTLNNPKNEDIELFFIGGDATMPWLQISVISKGKVVQQETGGGDFAFEDRPVDHRLFLVPITLKPNETITLIAGMDNHSVVQKVWIEPQTSFWSDENLTTLTDGIYLGTILLIGLMSALLYITDRDRLYLHIYIIIIGNTLYHFCRNGYAQQYLWPTTPGISDDWALATLNLSVIGGILFSMNYLNLFEQKQRWPAAISITYLIVTISVVPASLLFAQDIALPLIKVSGNMATLYFALIWCHAAKRCFTNDMAARVYAVVWVFYLVPLLVPVMLTYNHAQNELSTLLISRNGDMFLAIALWAALLLDVRKTHIEKNAAVIESKAKSDFLATMSHELRTPLNGVIGMGELLHQTEQTPLQHHYSDVIVSSGNVLLTLINDILDLTKINDGKLVFEKKPFQLDKMLPECTSSFIPEMLKQRTHLNATITADTPFCLIGDEYRLRQILFNLLSNAMKFTESGDVRVIASARPTDDRATINLIFEVIDTGIGIEKGALDHIFDPFSQADASTTRRFGGTGLGLAITKAIVEQLNGAITAQSTPGHGSSFTVKLPMQVNLGAEGERKQKLAKLRGKRILAIQDTEHVFDNIDLHIKNWGVTIDIVVGMEQARSQLRTTPTDYDMMIAYFMNGSEQQLEALQSLGKPLVIFYHAPLDSDHITWIAKTLFLSIPVSVGKLADTFLELLAADITRCSPKKSLLLPPEISSKSVLVVEDNLTNQMVVKGMLKHLGMTPDIANNGQEAVEMATARVYDVILMDCEMPVMDGFKASRVIMNNSQQPKPYIAALTAHALQDNADECKNAGIQCVLHKPITVNRLKELFETID